MKLTLYSVFTVSVYIHLNIFHSNVGDYLVMHLSELVRTSFIAATASVDALKLAGYQALQVRINDYLQQTVQFYF